MKIYWEIKVKTFDNGYYSLAYFSEWQRTEMYEFWDSLRIFNPGRDTRYFVLIGRDAAGGYVERYLYNVRGRFEEEIVDYD